MHILHDRPIAEVKARHRVRRIAVGALFRSPDSARHSGAGSGGLVGPPAGLRQHGPQGVGLGGSAACPAAPSIQRAKPGIGDSVTKVFTLRQARPTDPRPPA